MLPETSTSLGPLTNPGETEPIKPKIAMLVRLSSATIDALTPFGENGDKKELAMDFEFGKTPGIHIDGTFYPMRMQKEETPHEIYLRTTSTKNASAPLKLYANVTDKLFIEHTEIGDDLKDKIREKTMEAAKQRDDRRTKYIDAPPAPPTKVAKKKKEPTSMFRNAIRPSDQAKLTASTSSTRVPSPAPLPKKKKHADPALRSRLIRCMAVQDRTLEDIAKLLFGKDAEVTTDVEDLLGELAEPVSALKNGQDSKQRLWSLKNEAWLEVRPLEMPNLTDPARLQLSRNGRLKLKTLGFKDTDPEWAPFAYKPADASPTPLAGPSRIAGSEAQRTKPVGSSKNGISSKDVKKPKPQPDPNGEIRMKDESRVSSSSGTMKEVTASNSPATARKLPGSGFRNGKAPTQSDGTDGPIQNSAPRAKIGEKVAKLSRPSVPPKAIPPSAPPQKEKTGENTAVTQRVRKARESDTGVGSEIERNKVARPRPPAKHEGDSEKQIHDVPTLKRRPRNDYDSDTSTSLAAPQQKRRKENGADIAAKDPRPRDLSLPKKPDVATLPPRQKIRKEPSPLLPPPPLPKINKKANASSRIDERKMTPPPHETTSSKQPVQDSRSRGEPKVTGKRRRGSPIYTSSEDEGETRKVRREPPKAPSPALPANPNGRGTAQSRSHVREREPQPLPTDHASLRVRYTTTYGECMTALTALLSQKSKIDSMLRKAGPESVTDSDGDAELMDADELKKLSGDYERMHEELETIRQRFAEPVQ
ncbi:hypothetical protein DXG01_002504 [Tephrocybe rancida]|nr:hypothetical protein DXG01_002504 [Tephrocybe rancida]